MMTTFFFFFPAMLLSGFAFPIANMPQVVQWMTLVNPIRYFLVIVRGIFLKGVGIDMLWPQMLPLLLHGNRHALAGRAAIPQDAVASHWDRRPADKQHNSGRGSRLRGGDAAKGDGEGGCRERVLPMDDVFPTASFVPFAKQPPRQGQSYRVMTMQLA